MEDTTSMNVVPQHFFFGVGVVTAAGLVAYVAGAYGERLVAELGWLLCGIEVKAQRFAEKLAPYYRSVFPQPEPAEVKVYSLGKVIAELSYLEALDYNPKSTYDLVSYVVRADNGTSYTSLHSDIKTLTDKVKASPKRFLTAMVNKDGTSTEVIVPNGSSPYVIGNALFSPPYLRWAGLDIEDEAEYTVHLIDSDVVQKTVTWNKDKREVVRMTADGYDIEEVEMEKKCENTGDNNSNGGWFGLWKTHTKSD